MNLLILGFVLISIAMGVWLSRSDWLKMLVMVPLGALVPAFFGTGSNCGADFALHLYEAGRCMATDAPREVFAAFFVRGIVAVLVAGVLAKLARVVLGAGGRGQ